jgi:hypothetical protein
MSRRIALTLLVFLGSASLFVACSDDESDTISLSSLWPNADGLTWSFNGRALEFHPLNTIDDVFLYEDPDSVPPAPDWDMILDLIASPIYPATSDTVIGTYGLMFRDSIDTPAGTAQFLAQVVNGVMDTLDCSGMIAAALYQGNLSTGQDRRHLLRRALKPGDVSSGPVLPLFLHGGAFVKTEDFIGGYHCVSDTLSWLYVTSKLDPGTLFSVRPLPELAPEVVLHGRVGAPISVSTPAGVYSKAIEVDYYIDYGVFEYSIPTQFLRAIECGRIFYAPGVGPVVSWERNFVPVGHDTLGVGFGEVELRLIAHGPMW